MPLLKHIPSTWLSQIKAYDIAKTIVPNAWLQKIYDVDNASQLPDLIQQNIGKLTDEIGGVAGTANDAIDKASRLIPGEKDDNININPQDILFAHRAMQFSADRAAILCTQDLPATVYSIFLSNPVLHPYLPVVKEKGLLPFFKQESSDADLIAKQNLMMRCAAVIAFYLSDEYQQLVQEIRPT